MSHVERLAVIGDPIAHSLSPTMQRAALKAAGLLWTYEALHVPPDMLKFQVGRLREEKFRGFNVTVPHKEEIYRYVDEIDMSAAIGAVNTVVNRGGRLVGHNTDVQGFALALRTIMPQPTGGSAVVLGSGGAARAVVHALIELKVHTTVANRTLSRAEDLARETSGHIATIPLDDSAATAIDAADLVVNCTSVGLRADQSSPLPDGIRLRAHTVVLDLVYGRRTRLIEQAQEAGCTCMDGMEMLVQQGALSFYLWTGIQPDLTAMRMAAMHELEERQICCAS